MIDIGDTMEDVVKAQNTFATKVNNTGWYIGTRAFTETFFKAMLASIDQKNVEKYDLVFKDLYAGKVHQKDLEQLKELLLEIEGFMSKYKAIDVSKDINDNYEAHWKDSHEITNLSNSFITRMGDNVFDELLTSIEYALEVHADLYMTDINSGYLEHVVEPDPDDEKIAEIVATIEKGEKYPNHLIMHKTHERFVLPKFSETYTTIDLVDENEKVLLRRYFDHEGMVHMQIEFEED